MQRFILIFNRVHLVGIDHFPPTLNLVESRIQLTSSPSVSANLNTLFKSLIKKVEMKRSRPCESTESFIISSVTTLLRKTGHQF